VVATELSISIPLLYWKHPSSIWNFLFINFYYYKLLFNKTNIITLYVRNITTFNGLISWHRLLLCLWLWMHIYVFLFLTYMMLPMVSLSKVIVK
jgi:hypothetical protein